MERDGNDTDRRLWGRFARTDAPADAACPDPMELATYVTHAPGGDGDAVIENHLARCASCRNVVFALRKDGQPSPVEPPEALVRKIVALRKPRSSARRKAPRRVVLAVAAAAAAVILCALAIPTLLEATPRHIARILDVRHGAATIIRADTPITLSEGFHDTEILEGDVLETNARSAVRVQWYAEPFREAEGISRVPLEETVCTIGPSSRIELGCTEEGAKRMHLAGGDVSCAVAAQPHPMIVSTSHARVTVVGTLFSVRAGATRSRIDVLQGRVTVEKAGVPEAPPLDVSAGEYAVAREGAALERSPIAPEGEFDPFVGHYGGTFLAADGTRRAATGQVGLRGTEQEPYAGNLTVAAAGGEEGLLVQVHGVGKEGLMTLRGRTTGTQLRWEGTVEHGRLTLRRTEGSGERFETTWLEKRSPAEGAAPPPGALVLLPFDPDAPALPTMYEWTPESLQALPDGSVELKTQGASTTKTFRDMRLHVEFRVPVAGRGGLRIHDLYTVDIEDSLGTSPRDRFCGAMWGFKPADANACLAPWRWQTYDITFRAARLAEDGTVVEDPVITVVHNGIVIHDNLRLPHPLPEKPDRSHAPAGPVVLRNYTKNSVRFRNIWVRDLAPSP